MKESVKMKITSRTHVSKIRELLGQLFGVWGLNDAQLKSVKRDIVDGYALITKEGYSSTRRFAEVQSITKSYIETESEILSISDFNDKYDTIPASKLTEWAKGERENIHLIDEVRQELKQF